MKTLSLLTIFLALAPMGAAASADYTYLRPCVRANALGTAFSTVAGDPCAVFYNPANLSTLTAIEVKTETARRLSGDYPAGEVSLAYIRPVPDTESKVAGLGFYSARQRGGNGMDSLVFATGNSTVMKYFQKPLLYGSAVKLMNLREADKGHLGVGVEGGLQLESNGGVRTALTLSDLLMGMGRSLATITLGNSYTIKNTTLLADLRARGSRSELFLGAERPFFNGLMQARAGKGLALNGGTYVALGAGFNLLPWTIDVAWSLPWKGYNENCGYYGFSASYRFGAPGFSERLVGDAAREAENLKTEIDGLRAQRAALEAAIATARVNKNIAETDVTLMQSRLRELESSVKEMQVQSLEVQFKKENPKPAKVYAPPAPERWPKLHKAQAGETLRSIAGKYYGNPNLWERIYDANEKNISKGLPAEGAVLTIPPPPPAEKK